MSPPCSSCSQISALRWSSTFSVGGWTEWEPASPCTGVDGASFQLVERSCTNPVPICSECEGEKLAVHPCERIEGKQRYGSYRMFEQSNLIIGRSICLMKPLTAIVWHWKSWYPQRASTKKFKTWYSRGKNLVVPLWKKLHRLLFEFGN